MASSGLPELLDLYIGVGALNTATFGPCASFARLFSDGKCVDLPPLESSHSSVSAFALKSVVEHLTSISRVLDGDPAVTSIYIDNRYVADGYNKWMKTWEQTGWLTSNGTPVKQRAEWVHMKRLMKECGAEIHYLPVGIPTSAASNEMLQIAEEVTKLLRKPLAGKKVTDIWIDEEVLDQVRAQQPQPAAPVAPPAPRLANQGLW